MSDEYGIVEVQVVEMTEAAATKQASVTTLHQEPITWSLQLPHIPVTAFSQTDLS